MKKTMLAFMLALALVTMSACGAQDKTPEATAAPVVTEKPTAEPTEAPTAVPTEAPTAVPTEAPTAEPTEEPTEATTMPVVTEASTEATAMPVVTEAPTTETTAEPAAETEAQASEGEAEVVALEDGVLASAYDGAVTVTLSEVQEEYDQQLAAYIAYYTQYGYTVDEYDQEFQANVAQETVQMKLSQAIVRRYAEQNGYVLTAEKEEELTAQVQTALDNLREYYESYLSYYGYTGDELTQAVEEELANSGYTEEALTESAYLKDVLDFIYEKATADISVTEEEVKEAFDAKIASQKESYADIDSFINDYVSDSEILYTPENVRLMECIYIAKVDGEATDDEATRSEATGDEATADEAVNIDELSGYAKAKAVIAAIRGGEDFEEAMKAYNEDSSTEEQMLRGYPVAAESQLYGEEFSAGAMALENVGDVSDIITTDYGYFILRYAKDLTAGEADFESRKDAETEETLSNKKNDAYTAFINQILDEADMQIGDLSVLYHVYVGEAAEATVAYATVSEDAQLIDMPNGDAVANLKAGASLDILGKIGVDGENYSFVAVVGTEIKGYINDKALTELDSDAALAVDNTALASAVEQIDKNPTFTIAMNDGSLIYGELYPEKAPESVGNFISLANSNFYDGLTFHRVISGFMIQGGDPNGDGTGGPGYAIRGEFSSNGVENDLSHVRGVLSMARSSANDSAGSQFFIMHADGTNLDGQYAAFGMVLGGIENVDVIASVPTDSSDKPRTEQVMRTVYVETYGKTYTFTKLED